MITTISIRQPIIEVFLATGRGLIGKNWPLTAMSETVRSKLLGPIGLHVSTQRFSIVRKGEAAKHLRDYGLDGGKEWEYLDTPGHVVGKGRVIDILPGNLPMPELIERVRALYVPLTTSDEWVRGWFSLYADMRPKWLWVLGDVKPCKPTPWKGVMSHFPVPEMYFREA